MVIYSFPTCYRLSCCARVRVYGRFTVSLGKREPVPVVLLVCGLGDVPSPTLPSPTHSIACFCDFEDRRIPTPCVYMGMLGFAIGLTGVSHACRSMPRLVTYCNVRQSGPHPNAVT